MDYGKSFKFYRKRAKLTQKEAANLIGINPYQLGNYETNRSEPSLDVLKKMSKAYLISIDKLLGNNVALYKLEKEHPEFSQEYVDINEVLKKLNEYVDQQNKK